jgi:hypothetical protein
MGKAFRFTAGSRKRYWHKPYYDNSHRYHKGYWYWH